MKRTICLAVLLITSCAFLPEYKLYAQESENGVFRNKGYLIFFDDFLLFFPQVKFKNSVDFSLVEQTKGKLIRGTEGRIILNAYKKSKIIDVKQYYTEGKNLECRVSKQYKVVPVTIQYVLNEPIHMDDLSLYFNYNGTDYQLAYEDHADINLTRVDVMNVQ